MSGRKRSDVLLVGQTPPPYHGQAVVTAMLFDHEWDGMQVERLRMAYSASIETVGSASFGKVRHLFSLVVRTWRILLLRRPRILYYLPASPGLVPVLRDLAYLGLVRWFFPKIVFHYHAGGLDTFVRDRFWLRGLARIVYGRADVSIEVNEWLPPTGHFFEAGRNLTVPNGVKVERLERDRPASARFQLLYVGMLCEEKGISELVEAMALLRGRGVDCEVKLVGAWVSDAYREEMLASVARAGLADAVLWAGVLNGTPKWQAYADADCFVFPSHHPTETFGLVLVEAMAFGLPVIATRWRGIPTVVGDDGCATLCDIHSPGQYAEAAARIAGDLRLRARMGEASRERYANHFTEARFLGQMEDVFLSLLER